MQLYHTSPDEITEPKNGLFGDFLCFSGQVYTMTAAADPVVYRLEIREDEVIDASSIWYDDNAELARPYAEQIMSRYGVDEDTAESLIDGSASLYDVDADIDAEDMAEADWCIQRLTAEAGRAMGYAATAVKDEQGVCYMIAADKAIAGWERI